MFGIGGGELLLIIILSLILIKPEQLPQAAKTLGKIYGYFQRITYEAKISLDKETDLIKESISSNKEDEKLARNDRLPPIDKD